MEKSSISVGMSTIRALRGIASKPGARFLDWLTALAEASSSAAAKTMFSAKYRFVVQPAVIDLS